jgi:hypothetical protein
VGTRAVLLHLFKPLVCIADEKEIIRYHLSLVGCDEYLGCTENIRDSLALINLSMINFQRTLQSVELKCLKTLISTQDLVKFAK